MARRIQETDSGGLLRAAMNADRASRQQEISIPTRDSRPLAGGASCSDAVHGIHAVVTSIHVDNTNKTVEVVVSASLDRLFPSIVPDISVTQVGLAKVRGETWEQ